MLKYFPEGSFNNPYKAVDDFLNEYIMTHENYYSDLIVSIETENLGKSNEYCSLNEDWTFTFDDDWHEGGWIKVYGYVHLDDVQVPEMDGDEHD